MTKLHKKIQSAPDNAEDGMKSGQLLALALFLMLLAFFIVLNAISSFEEVKVTPAMQSLGQTFGTKYDNLIIMEVTGTQPSEKEHIDESTGEGSTVEKMQALFESEIAGHKAQINKSDGTLFFKAPYDEFLDMIMSKEFREANVTSEKAEQAFTPTFISLLRQEERGRPYRLHIILTVDKTPAHLKNKNPRLLQNTVLRLEEAIKILTDAGLQNRLIDASVSQSSDPDFIEIFIEPDSVNIGKEM